MRKIKIAVWAPINNIATAIKTFTEKPKYRLSIKSLKNKYKNMNTIISKNINLKNI
tara:strand:+ start:693 stop:860 length:168 start_codon:yes stop_codon:yes gene_type:complete